MEMSPLAGEKKGEFSGGGKSSGWREEEDKWVESNGSSKTRSL